MLKRIVKFNIILFAIFCLFVTLGKSECYAVVDVHTAAVVLTGPSQQFPNNVLVTLVNKTGVSIGDWAPNKERSFYLDKSISNQGLATCLTALAMNKTVFVRLGAVTPGSAIYIVYTR